MVLLKYLSCDSLALLSWKIKNENWKTSLITLGFRSDCDIPSVKCHNSKGYVM